MPAGEVPNEILPWAAGADVAGVSVPKMNISS